jgi:hypothetical protein
MKNSVFWHTTPCSPLKVRRRFGGTSMKQVAKLSDGFLPGLLFNHEEEGDMFLRNVG